MPHGDPAPVCATSDLAAGALEAAVAAAVVSAINGALHFFVSKGPHITHMFCNPDAKC